MQHIAELFCIVDDFFKYLSFVEIYSSQFSL